MKIKPSVKILKISFRVMTLITYVKKQLEIGSLIDIFIINLDQ